MVRLVGGDSGSYVMMRVRPALGGQLFYEAIRVSASNLLGSMDAKTCHHLPIILYSVNNSSCLSLRKHTLSLSHTHSQTRARAHTHTHDALVDDKLFNPNICNTSPSKRYHFVKYSTKMRLMTPCSH